MNRREQIDTKKFCRPDRAFELLLNGPSVMGSWHIFCWQRDNDDDDEQAEEGPERD